MACFWWRSSSIFDKSAGRISVKIAEILMGKHRPDYNPSQIRSNEYCIVVNALKIHMKEPRNSRKIYYRHTGRPGGIKERTLKEYVQKKPEEFVRKLVKGNLPKNKLFPEFMKHLIVYPCPFHEMQSEDIPQVKLKLVFKA